MIDYMATMIDSIKGPCVVLGDFNLDCLQFLNDTCGEDGATHTSPSIVKYVNTFLSLGYSPLISKATRHDTRHNTSTLIDQVWCNYITPNVFSGVISSTVSDHLPIFCYLPVCPGIIISSSGCNGKRYDTSSPRLQLFADKIQPLFDDLNVFSKTHSPAQNYSHFHNKFLEVHEECFVVNISTSTPRNQNNKPWISSALARSCKVKDVLYKRWIRGKYTPNSEVLYQHYRLYRSKLRDLLKENKYF